MFHFLLRITALGFAFPAALFEELEIVQKPATRKRITMVRTVSDSSSIVLRVTHILLIRILSANPTEWKSTTNGKESRTVELRVKLLEVLKGPVKERPGQEIGIQIAQERIQTVLLLPPSAGWSDRSLKVGDELVAFSVSSTDSLSELLLVPACKQVWPTSICLEDLRIAIKAEQEELPLTGVLAAAKPKAASLHPIFAEYLTARLSELSVETPTNFGALMEFLEQPALPATVDSSLLDSINSYISSSPKTSGWHFDRLAIAMFRLLDSSPDSVLRDNLVSVDLPNLLGILAGHDVRTAKEVFRDYPRDRLVAERALQRYHGEASTAKLLAWLNAS